MAHFLAAHHKTLKHEAGYAFDSKDGGGETWAGVSRKNHPLWPGWGIVDAVRMRLKLQTFDNPPAWRLMDEALKGNAELARLVEDVYRGQYWAPLQLDGEPSQAVAEKAYDIAVNMGVKVAREFLAKARAA